MELALLPSEICGEIFKHIVEMDDYKTMVSWFLACKCFSAMITSQNKARWSEFRNPVCTNKWNIPYYLLVDYRGQTVWAECCGGETVEPRDYPHDVWAAIHQCTKDVCATKDHFLYIHIEDNGGWRWIVETKPTFLVRRRKDGDDEKLWMDDANPILANLRQEYEEIGIFSAKRVQQYRYLNYFS